MSSSNTKLLAAFALIVTFVVGAVVGFVGDRAMLMHRGGRMPPHMSGQFIVHRLDSRLNLNDQQRAQITEIVQRHEKRIAGIWSGVRPAVRAELEGANVEIDRVLTPEQRAKFAKMRMHLRR